MRYSWSKSAATMKRNEAGSYNEEVFRKEFEKAVKAGHVYGVPLKKGKRFRSAFTTEQVNYLEKEFRKYPYLGNARRKDVSTILNIPERAVKIWFQNRRMKEKKDTLKDTDDKPTDNNSINNQVSMDVMLTPNDIPILHTKDSTIHKAPDCRVISVNHETINIKDTSSANTANYYKEITPKRVDFNVSKENSIIVSTPHLSTSVIMNNPATVTKESPVDVYKKYKLEDISEEEDRTDDTVPTKEAKQDLSFNTVVNNPEQISFTYTSPSASPQDLSSKTNVQQKTSQKPTQQVIPDTRSTGEVPLYLKGFYAQPYIPPGNVMWKPINVTPIMSAPMPTMAIPAVNDQNLKRCCNCDCHLKPTPIPTPAPMYFHPNNPNPNLQYVISAVPFPNLSSKF